MEGPVAATIQLFIQRLKNYRLMDLIITILFNFKKESKVTDNEV